MLSLSSSVEMLIVRLSNVPNEGPYKGLQPGLMTFRIDRGGKPETITVNRLKPAHIDLEHPSVPQPHRRPLQNPQPAHTGTTQHHNPDAPNSLQQQCTRSGRCIKPPQRYISVLGGVV